MRSSGTFAVSAALFAGIYALRVAVPDPRAGILFLMLVPIALLALEAGVRGGLTGAVVATLLTTLWVASEDIDLSPIGFITRFAAFAISGIGTGLLVEQRRRRDREIGELAQTAERHGQALDLHETVVQQLTVAKMGLEMGDADHALRAIDDALKAAQAAVSRGVDLDENLRTNARGPAPSPVE